MFTKRALVAILLGCAPLGALSAAGLQMIPIRLGLDSETPAAILTAINTGTDDVVYQLSVSEWSQGPDGRDQLVPTRDVLANPGIFTVRAGNQQLIRLGLRTGAAPKERSYRVIVQELPQPNRPGKGLQTLLRVSIPLFIPAQSPVTDMRWTLRPGPDGAKLTGINNGSVHVQITGVQITATNGADAPPAARMSVYLLPGVSREMAIGGGKPLAPGATYHLRIETDQGAMTADVRADAPTMASAG